MGRMLSNGTGVTSNSGGAIKSIQTGRYSLWNGAVTVIHDPVDMNKSELRIYGGGDQSSTKGTGINEMARYLPLYLERNESGFTHTPTGSNGDLFSMINSAGSLIVTDLVSGIYWELIEYA